MAEIMEGLSKAAEFARDTAKKGVDSAKLKWAILRLEGSLEDSYTTLGKFLSDNRDRLTDEKCLAKITALYEQIDKQKSDLELLKEAKPLTRKPSCPSCGKTLRREDVYCPGCGKKVESGTAATEVTEMPANEAETPAEAVPETVDEGFTLSE